jgi:hypothetical protein
MKLFSGTGRWRTVDPFLALALAWLGAVVATQPWGNYPVNDDWAYARAALNFAEGRFVYSDWQGMPLFSQAMWGALWIKAFGFSFTMLRISMLPVVLLGGWYVRAILNERIGRSGATVAAAVLLFTPLSFHLSLSFMTDWFALTMALGAAFHFIRMQDKPRMVHGVAATLLVIIGVLCRQTVLIVPAVLALYGLKRRSGWAWPVAAGALGLLALVIHDRLMPLPANYGLQFNALGNRITDGDWHLLQNAAFYLLNAVALAGISLLPLHVLRPFRFTQRAVWLALPLGALFVVRCVAAGQFWPFTGDVWHARGIGPWLVDGGNSNSFTPQPWAGLLVGLVGTTSFALLLSGALQLRWLVMGALFVFPAGALYLSDRYALPLVAFVLVAILWHVPLNTKRAIPLLVATALISIASQRAYFGMRDAQWQLFRHAGGPVDAGFELNAWHRFTMGGYDPGHPERSWAGDAGWRLSLRPEVDGYTVADSATFVVFPTAQQRTQYLHRRD